MRAMGRKRPETRELYEIRQDHPYFKGFFTREKLITLIDLKEREGWTYMGDKDILKIGSFGTGLGHSDSHHSQVVAVFERVVNRS
jgi:hypothetical protein